MSSSSGSGSPSASSSPAAAGESLLSWPEFDETGQKYLSIGSESKYHVIARAVRSLVFGNSLLKSKRWDGEDWWSVCEKRSRWTKGTGNRSHLMLANDCSFSRPSIESFVSQRLVLMLMLHQDKRFRCKKCKSIRANICPDFSSSQSFFCCCMCVTQFASKSPFLLLRCLLGSKLRSTNALKKPHSRSFPPPYRSWWRIP